ncbi:siderophore ABC transporter substrate-binding protein [Vagococcus acidifermentans]|uniref:Iron ABC transporter substrate-binding protein n=1 Tax=Vagococcus acidifermentans TaxID=564710 RepID=A0A430AUQ2_9ENTE|nr:siderophore ABC transporter substrate-binding protein [Vagococcus acidifermentans]RSU11776.1 iron ABC transporter substrate-binding protein [Vagococcus acidifermentans]
MKKKMIGFLTILAMGSLFLAGCSTNGKETATSTSSSEAAGKEKQELAVKDSEGHDVTVPVNPKNVVVFDMGVLDTLKALGKDKAVTAVPTESLPAYLESYGNLESAGGIKEPDLEKINALQPELIIISGRQSDAKADLEKIAPTLYLSAMTDDMWGSTKTNVQTLARIFDAEKEAQAKLDELETQISDLKKKADASDAKALITLVNEGSLSAYGHGSRFGLIHDTFGVKEADDQIEVSTHGQEVSYEYVLEKNPDILFVVDRTKAIGGDDSKNNVAENELVKQTNAGKNNQVITLTPDVWYLSGGGLESTELMIKDVAKAFD